MSGRWVLFACAAALALPCVAVADEAGQCLLVHKAAAGGINQGVDVAPHIAADEGLKALNAFIRVRVGGLGHGLEL